MFKCWTAGTLIPTFTSCLKHFGGGGKVKGFNVSILRGFLQGFGFMFGLFLTGCCEFSDRSSSRYYLGKAEINQSLRDCKSICNDLIQCKNRGSPSLETVESAAAAEPPATAGCYMFQDFSLDISIFQISTNRETWHSPGSLN